MKNSFFAAEIVLKEAHKIVLLSLCKYNDIIYSREYYIKISNAEKKRTFFFPTPIFFEKNQTAERMDN